MAPILATLLGACAAEATTAPSRVTPVATESTSTSGSVSSNGGDAAIDPAIDGVATADPPVTPRCSAIESACADGHCDAAAVASRRPLRRARGPVSYYADRFHGRRTASGDVYDRRDLTAASRTLPFGALVRVRRVGHPESIVVVRINDRGPFGRNGRILDLSRAAAECIDMIRAGVVEVEAEVIDWGPRGEPN